MTDSRDDEVLTSLLAAAVAYVERELDGDFDFDGTLAGVAPSPTDDVETGTVRLARRWLDRRNSPGGLIDMGEFGSARISSYDSDIERMLGIGRFRRPMV